MGVELLKILGTQNPADLFTKALGEEVVLRHLQKMGVEFCEGRSESAAKVMSMSAARSHHRHTINRDQMDSHEPWNTVLVERVAIENAMRHVGEGWQPGGENRWEQALCRAVGAALPTVAQRGSASTSTGVTAHSLR